MTDLINIGTIANDGTGDPIRTAFQKLNRNAPGWLSVLSYGAIGNGVADDGPAWNTARAAVPSTGGAVYVPPGSYNLATAFTFGSQSNVQLILAAGVVLTGLALPLPAGTSNTIVDWRATGVATGHTALSLPDNGCSLSVGVNFGGPPRIQVGSGAGLGPGNRTLLELGYNSTVAADGGILWFTRVRGTSLLAPSAILNNDELGAVIFGGSDTTAVYPGASIRATAYGNWGVGSTPGRLIFGTNPGGGTVLVDRWQLGGDGNIIPLADGTYSIGAVASTMAAIFARRVVHGTNFPTYGANIAIDATWDYAEVVPSNGSAFTFNTPLNVPAIAIQRLTIRIKNTFGVLGAATFAGGAGGYRLGGAWVQPLNGFSRMIEFIYDGTNWIENSRSPVDVAN